MTTVLQDVNHPPWHHGPLHRFDAKGAYIVTGSTLHRDLLFQRPNELSLVQDTLLSLADQYGWQPDAWAVFPNHYHFVAQCSADPRSLKKFIQHLHSLTARELNALHGTPGRKVWHQFWDTQLTYQKSYFARLRYVMDNPVKHGVVRDAKEYLWCSASWFANNASPSLTKTVNQFTGEGVTVPDNF